MVERSAAQKMELCDGNRGLEHHTSFKDVGVDRIELISDKKAAAQGACTSVWKPKGAAFEPYSFLQDMKHQQQHTSRIGGGGLGLRKTSPLRLVVSKPIVAKLTTHLMETYQLCNPSFIYTPPFIKRRILTHPSTAVSNNGLDNCHSDLILEVNGVLANSSSNQRYIVKDFLGQGTFGQVVKCWMDEADCFVAVKVIKNQPAYYHQALVEISILTMLNVKFDPGDKHHIVRITDHFYYQGHLCIVFELLAVNLFEVLKVNHYKGISLHLLQLFTKQIVDALVVLRDANVIHCDLKPENILLTSLQSGEIKIIDFGSACMENRPVYSYIQSRFYRSPEVVLGHPYTTAIDMWSLGCIAAELFLGVPLFPGESEYDLLKRMIEILGVQPPDHMLHNSKNTVKYFRNTSAAPLPDGKYLGDVHSSYQFLSEEEYEMNASSVGAVAGLAIALLCTWKYLKLQDNRRKRIPKPESTSSSSGALEGAASGTSTAIAKGITQPSQRGGSNQETSFSSQVPLAQLIRRQLLGGRKMTCQLLGVVLQELTAEELRKHVIVRPSVVEVLLELARVCDLYLFAKVLDDESEVAVLGALDAVGVFTLGTLNRNKVLFYSTEAGGASFVRQLEPDWHVDSSGERVDQLARFVPHLLHVAPFGASTFSANIVTTESLEDYFALKNQN